MRQRHYITAEQFLHSHHEHLIQILFQRSCNGLLRIISVSVLLPGLAHIFDAELEEI